jgi:N-acyl-phosphatidylethanolamine-hydrolysing phospholipase D
MAWPSSQRSSGRFFNRHIRDIKRDLWDAILWRLGYYDEGPRNVERPRDFVYPANLLTFDQSRPSVQWIGHSTFIIQVNGLTFLTDPIFSLYCSPIHCEVFKRRNEPAMRIEDLPLIDCVLISHNHYDHLDEKSIIQLHREKRDIIWIVPRGLKRWFEKRSIHSVYELNWSQAHQLNQNCRITAVPAQHFSGRHLWDKNRTLWCGYIVECQGKTFYFVGDTGYNPVDFKQIGKNWPSIDLSLIPIGVYVPKKFMQPVHINPYEAVNIHCDTGSRLSLGMHWNTFRLSEEPMDLPPYELYLAMKERGLAYETFLPIDPGLSINW